MRTPETGRFILQDVLTNEAMRFTQKYYGRTSGDGNHKRHNKESIVLVLELRSSEGNIS